MTRRRGRLLRALMLGPLLVAGLVPAVGAAAAPISAAAGPISGATPISGTGPIVTADPCVDRPPTELDRRRDWQCVGLARYTAAGVEPAMGSLTADEARRLDVTRPASYEYGVAVSPDGRLYRQTAPAPVGPPETRSHNPTPPDVDPEGEAGTGAFTPNTVFPPDDRVLRLSTTSYPWRAITSVLTPGKTASKCSGSLIGPRHLLTAGHCIHQGGGGTNKGWFSNLKVAPGQKGIGVFPNGLKNHSWYFTVSGWYDNADPAHDYAMIVLEDRNDTAHLGWLGWRSSDHSGGHWTFGYPGASHTCAASPSPSGLCDNFQYGDDSPAFSVLSKQIGTVADANPGQSGSAIYKWNNGDRRVIAVMAYHGNWGTRITSTRSSNLCNWIHAFPSAFNDHQCE